jgi:hypothetical protein
LCDVKLENLKNYGKKIIIKKLVLKKGMIKKKRKKVQILKLKKRLKKR